MVEHNTFIVIITLALACSFFAWIEAAKQEQKSEKNGQLLNDAASAGYVILGAITGGKSFCFLKLNLGHKSPKGNPNQLWIEGKGNVYEMNYWISPASSEKNVKDAAYMSLDVNKPLHTIVYNGCRAYPRELGVGDYRIEIDARNGQWVERLTITEKFGKLSQKIRVFDPSNNQTIHEEASSATD